MALKPKKVVEEAEIETEEAEGEAAPAKTGLFAKLTETVEDTMRAGKIPLQAITGTMGLMDSAAKVMRGLAAAGQAVVEEAVRAAETPGSRPLPPHPPSERESGTS